MLEHTSQLFTGSPGDACNEISKFRDGLIKSLADASVEFVRPLEPLLRAGYAPAATICNALNDAMRMHPVTTIEWIVDLSDQNPHARRLKAALRCKIKCFRDDVLETGIKDPLSAGVAARASVLKSLDEILGQLVPTEVSDGDVLFRSGTERIRDTLVAMCINPSREIVLRALLGDDADAVLFLDHPRFD